MSRIWMRWRAAGQTAWRRVASGVSLIELIAVAVILGVLALIVVPNVVHSLDLAKSNTLKTQIATVQEASDNYYAQTGQYPAYCQPSSTVPGCELDWVAGDPFVPDFLRSSPSALPAVYGLAPSNGAVVYWGVDQQGDVFATQVAPNSGDPDAWNPLPTPRTQQSGTISGSTTTQVATLTSSFGSWQVKSGGWVATSAGGLQATQSNSVVAMTPATNTAGWTMDFTTPSTVPATIAINLVNAQGDGYRLVWQTDNNWVLYNATFNANDTMATLGASTSDGQSVSQQANTSYRFTWSRDAFGNWQATLTNTATGHQLQMLPTAGTYNDTTYAGPWSIALNADAGVTITGFSDVPVETSGTLTTAFGSWSVGYGAWAVQADGSVTGYSNTGNDTSGITDLADNANATQWTLQFTTGATVPEDIILNLVNGSSEGYQLHWQAGDNNLVLYQCSFSGYNCSVQGSASDYSAVKQAANTAYQLVLSVDSTNTWTVTLENSAGSTLTSFSWTPTSPGPYNGPWTPSLVVGPGITLSHYAQ